MLTGTIDGLMSYTSGGNQAAGAGAVILIVMQVKKKKKKTTELFNFIHKSKWQKKKKKFFWVILFGSTEESLVYQFIYSGFVSPVSQNVVNIGMHGSNGSPKDRESKIALSSPEATSYHTHQQQPSIASVHQPHHQQSPVLNPPIPTPGMAQQQQILTAIALHPCKFNMLIWIITYWCKSPFIDTANPDDPNELSFGKEEVLEILNKSGNWWQAKKQDGTVGIVPSNYVCWRKKKKKKKRHQCSTTC